MTGLNTNDWKLDRTVSLGLVLAFAVQLAAGLTWAGRAAARIDQVEARLAAGGGTAERLARLEALETIRAAQLDRIEAKLDRMERGR